ncbi:MAG: biotin/lipoyl-binding protein, partial [Ktedonobacteraceae bacterium]|nr:biotin/lipoyl-binding protein [Ktedonobacteraceae bacterium]
MQNRPDVTDDQVTGEEQRKQDKSEQSKSEQDKPEQGKSEQSKSEQSGVSGIADPVSDAVWLVDIRKRLSKDLRREVRNRWQVARQGGLRHWQRVRQVPLRVLIPVLLLIVCVLLSATSAWWFLYATNGVSVYRVEAMKPVDRDVGGGGVIYPRQQFDISYPMAERVIDVLVKAGDRVKVDQPLIKLDPVQVKSQLQLAASDVQAARSYLYSVSNIANAVVVAQAEQSYRIAQNRYNAVTAQNANFHNGILSASMEGVVTAVNINPGETAAPNAIMLTIMD